MLPFSFKVITKYISKEENIDIALIPMYLIIIVLFKFLEIIQLFWNLVKSESYYSEGKN